MYRRDTGIFALGFALGALCVAAVLWATGSLQLGTPPHPQMAATSTTTAPPANGMPGPQVPPPDISDFSAPQPNHPLDLPQATVGAGDRSADRSAGEADRMAPAAGNLVIPVAGVTAKQLRDDFNEAHNGHKHEAIDILAPRGTQVLAATEGNVAKLFNSKEGGLTVYQFDNAERYCYYYAHLDHYAPNLKEGTLLRKGDVIGYVGTTGDAPANTPHLHFAIFKLGPEKEWWKGTAIDPFPLLSGRNELR